MDMTPREELKRRVRTALATEGLADKMSNSTSRAMKNRSDAIHRLHIDVNLMKQSIKTMKAAAVKDQSLPGRFAEKVRANGGVVYFASTGADAVGYVAALAVQHGADLLTKSKSITSEEIEFDQEMEKRGVACIETDLGELIVQMAHEKPVHIVMPAAHKSVGDVAELFSARLGSEVSPEPDAILKAVREYLRPRFLSAKIGVTGANAGIAETGTVILQTNEGNGRLTSGAPEIHVVLMGVEKIVPTWEDAANVVVSSAVSATGQNVTVYVSAFSGHSPMGGDATGREFHVIILDNGRSRMMKSEWFSDALNCIRCGACMNICPTYAVVGGHTFGYIYPGPVGIPWTSFVHGLDKVTYADLCISCGLCKMVCPADIDLPMMIAQVKQEQVDLLGQTRANRFFAGSETLAKVASATAPVSNWLMKSGPGRYVMERVFGVERKRTLPVFSRRRLRQKLKGVGNGNGIAGKVVYFPDIYSDYNDPDVGVKVVKILSAIGYKVEIPDVSWSGMPYISYGEVRKATQVARRNVRILTNYVKEGYEIVTTEPTAGYMLRDAYLKLVPGGESERVAEHSHPFFEFIEPYLSRLTLKATMPLEGEIGFHIPCHDRPFSAGRPAIKFLSASGYRVRIVETGTCCGIGGTFGMKAGTLGYDLSNAAGKALFDLFKESHCEIACTESSVCSTQISDGTGIRVFHPLHLVDLG